MADIRQAIESVRAARGRTKKELAQLEAAIRALQGLPGGDSAGRKQAVSKRRRTMSAAARKKIAAAQKARWAKVRKLKAANG